MQVTVEYWRCLRGNEGLILVLQVSGHRAGARYTIQAALHHRGSKVDVVLEARDRLEESPATIEVVIPTESLGPGKYDVSVTMNGEHVGTFPCEVGEPQRA